MTGSQFRLNRNKDEQKVKIFAILGRHFRFGVFNILLGKDVRGNIFDNSVYSTIS